MFEFGKKISFEVFYFFRFRIQIPANTRDENNLKNFTVMVGATIKGVLLGAAQFQTGDNVGDFDALSHSIQWIRTEPWKARLAPVARPHAE